LGEDIEIVFSGLKPGEKLFEELQHIDEQHEPTAHPKIMRFVSPNAGNGHETDGVVELEVKLYSLESNEIKQALKLLVPEYTPFLD
jgi:FlaA1/EpsC-like NDP-sugar epimerase